MPLIQVVHVLSAQQIFSGHNQKHMKWPTLSFHRWDGQFGWLSIIKCNQLKAEQEAMIVPFCAWLCTRCCCLVVKSCLTLLRPPWTVAHLALLSIGFLRQEYWSGMKCHSLLQSIFPTEGSNSSLLNWQVGSLPLSHKRSPYLHVHISKIKQTYRQKATANRDHTSHMHPEFSGSSSQVRYKGNCIITNICMVIV